MKLGLRRHRAQPAEIIVNSGLKSAENSLTRVLRIICAFLYLVDKACLHFLAFINYERVLRVSFLNCCLSMDKLERLNILPKK